MKNGFYFLGLCICLCLWASCSSMEEVRDYNEKYTGEYTSRIAFPIGGLGTGMFCVEGSGAISNMNIWGIERSVFSMVGKNGQKVLKTKGFRHGRENGLNISKRFFSLHGLTSALRLRGFSSDIRGIALHRACRWG